MGIGGEAAVYSPDVADKAAELQTKTMSVSKKFVILCNSQFMVNQVSSLARQSGIYEKASLLQGNDDLEILNHAYNLLDINENELIK